MFSEQTVWYNTELIPILYIIYTRCIMYRVEPFYMQIAGKQQRWRSRRRARTEYFKATIYIFKVSKILQRKYWLSD